MRNVILILAFGLFIVFFSSCSSKPTKVGPGVCKDIEVTTSTVCEQPELADRFTCSGKKLSQPKVVGWNLVEIEQDTVLGCSFSDEDLQNAGYIYTGENPVKTTTKTQKNSNLVPWNLLEWLALILAALGLLWLILWLLREFILWLTRPQNNHQNAQATPAQNPEGTFVPEGYTLVPEGYSLVPNGTILIPANGIYLGVRNQGEEMEAGIYTPTPPEIINDPKDQS